MNRFYRFNPIEPRKTFSDKWILVLRFLKSASPEFVGRRVVINRIEGG